MTGPLYAFEGISDELPQPSLSVYRALSSVGILLTAAGWQGVAVPLRRELATLGAAPVVHADAVRACLRGMPMRELSYVSPLVAPDASRLPADLAAAFGPAVRVSDEDWRSLAALDRFVLTTLAANTRLLVRALREIFARRPGVVGGAIDATSGAVGHCEVDVGARGLAHVRSSAFMEGRALVLARVAGVRAARRAGELLGFVGDESIGNVELDWTASEAKGTVLWQAHVSTWNGRFHRAASLLAVTVAGASLCEMVRDVEPAARLTLARIAEEPWQVGSEADDDATLYKPGA